MHNTLFIGNPRYSSWSLRGWLAFDRFDIPVALHPIDFSRSESVAAQLAEHLPEAVARTVPTWVTPEGVVVSESLAIGEELASRYPEAGHWPADPAARAVARTLAAEMASGFAALREACPMNILTRYAQSPVSAAVRADLDRLEALWAWARRSTGSTGPWLCGAYSLADVAFAPVAARIATYALPVSDVAAAYVAAHLSDPSFLKWQEMARAEGITLDWYKRDYPLV